MAGMINRMRQKKVPDSNASHTDWSKNGSFINKPARGWLHPDEKLLHGGVCYGVRYVGCLEVKQSMRTLEFDVRGQVTKEAIHRVCEASGFKNINKKRKVNKAVSKILGAAPNIQFGGANVNLTVSTNSINLMIMETGQIIANHQMQGISFASGGDPDCIDFVAYVAKDPVNGRACHVIECAGGLAQDVITTVGQAFELRFKEYLRNPPKAVQTQDRFEVPIFEESDWGDEPEYYNDLGKLPPIPKQVQPVPPLPSAHYQTPSNVPATSSNGAYASLKDKPRNRHQEEAIYDNKSSNEPNLIDFENEAAVPGGGAAAPYAKLDDLHKKTVYQHLRTQDPEYEVAKDTSKEDSQCIYDNAETEQPVHSAQLNLYEEPEQPKGYDTPNSAKASYDVPKSAVIAFDDNIYSLPQHLHSSDVGNLRSGRDSPMDTSQSQAKPQTPPTSVASQQNNSIQQSTVSSTTDVFDMEPFQPGGGAAAATAAATANSEGVTASEHGGAATADNPAESLQNEIWFHGPLTRKQAELLLEEDGDFLVRESTTTPGQYVLSGMQGGHSKHLLLVDPKGVVRTKDKVFDSVVHLISYHRDNKVPIMSAGSAVKLSQPVLRH
ncbi:SHC-transforming protein 1-like isoform X1 [Ptychodera flava]|uniref:SHC-transforming protein 1-like isoform X1 n=1 Tax=Ptychodera flava TaxID=63121 RepID=UPI00396A8260